MHLCIVRVISKKILGELGQKHPDCPEQLKSWHKEAEEALWITPKDIKKDYPTVSILQDNRMVFNIKGNNYRLIVKINYHFSIVWIRCIGTHAEYDKIDANKI